ncbi:hypothetical protein B9Z55_027047 [Caenorhabditis nigoni]|uniref:F-box domain-containing protein n=1 Tax=Caenorhabditis nigoni TaxID=1611254 RepID=A0A2G5SIY6_9PELO|nr:hypothetical protein B9Z55_027047 [Caenorhabditis nigoni]
MKLSSDFIEKNQHFLKSCILYEVLQKKPIFDSYRNFCDTVGKDAMDYPDFEFWYYRFYHGNRDLDYDRSVDPEPKALVDMPVVLMKKITQNLDSIERARLRYMNHVIQNVVDSFPPVFGVIQISVSDTSMSWWLDERRFSCYKEDNGCKFVRSDSPKVERSEECYMKKSLKYLNPLFKMPNLQVDHFSLDFYDEMPDRDDLFPVPLNAKSVHIDGYEESKVAHFLAAMTPGYLESIRIKIMNLRETENYRMIFGTDQFKQAKNVEFVRMYKKFNVADLVQFSHLKSFKCSLTSENTFQDVPRIRDIISTFEKLESCELKFMSRRNRFPIRAFAEALGEEVPIEPLTQGERLTITHRDQIPESNECLEFKIKEEEEYYCLVNIVKVR